MKRLLVIVVLGLLLSNCADYIAEKERLKLQKENTALEDDITPFLEAEEENVEDFEFQHEGVDTFWPCFNYLVLSMLAKRSVATKSPIFIF